ncbi:intein-containing sodium/potassium-transporting atpase subunit alpha precursor [Anaeramoeba ignava]|uniref:Intein-containing sodium/potassium-transporting atpase subunit alpha n=1 Tax=Anaeramoeba ignava TaxID=1746090 RepID=A0A9Q0LR13_ANAIG|nr:intein-containing sodium/potassium-transporting atpase subunit alpha precursor [Anaeramoeba ignava]
MSSDWFEKSETEKQTAPYENDRELELFDIENSISRHNSEANQAEILPELNTPKSLQRKFSSNEISIKKFEAKKDEKQGKRVNKDILNDLKKEISMNHHQMDLDELYLLAGTDPIHGLTEEQARESLRVNGPNCLKPPKSTPEIVKFLKQMTGGFSLLLLVGGILCFIGYGLDTSTKDNLYLGLVLVGIVIFTGIFSYYQEHKSGKIMEGFKKLVPQISVVIRDGKQKTIDATQIVPGDIILVKAGDKIPADIRIIESSDFQVDNSSLTGESDPQSRTVKCTSENPLETANLAFYSTLATQGHAKGVSIFTGDSTVIGRIAGLAAATKTEDTPIRIEIRNFIKIITIVSVILGVLFFTYGMISKTSWITNVIFMIGIIVANVPEGILTSVAVTLALTANRMSKRSVLVKNLEAVETLGSTCTIASDKCLGLNTPIMMYNGSIKLVQDVLCGEKLMGDDSKPRNVLSTTKGFGKMYRITPEKAQYFTANYCHILCLRSHFPTSSIYDSQSSFIVQFNLNHSISQKIFPYSMNNKLKVKKDAEKFIQFIENSNKAIEQGFIRYGSIVHIIVEDFLRLETEIQSSYKLYKADLDTIIQSNTSLDIDSYTFGVWIGARELSSFRKLSETIPTKIKKELSSNLNEPENIIPNDTFSFLENQYRSYFSNSNFVIDNGIPDQYRLNSRENRKKLLSGILDSREFVANPKYSENHFDFVITSEKFKQDFQQLCNSLGFDVQIETEKRNKFGAIHKIKLIGNEKENDQVISIEYIGNDEFYGFEIDGNRRFLLGDFTVTHNTGTLTQNKMSVTHLWYDNRIYSSDITLETDCYDKTSEAFQQLMNVATLCNREEYQPDNKEKLAGNASEIALINFFGPLYDPKEVRKSHPQIKELPFNSTNKFMLTIHQISQDSEEVILMMKGAPERIITRCSTIMINGEELELTEEWRRRYEEANEIFADNGERVLGFCQLRLPYPKYSKSYPFDVTEFNFPIETGMCLVGLVSLIDPPRPSVSSAVAKCKTAGIKVIMVTGDHPTTAKAIAKQVGIIWSETVDEYSRRTGIDTALVTPKDAQAIVIHGAQLKDMDEDQLDRVLQFPQIVFARTSPQQKLLIVEGCQRRKEVVAVTGDGVNDSPALKKADIGIAMGITGSDVSKEAADMILLDDNFSSIVNGVEEGRIIFDNLKKTIAYTLTSNIPEIVPFLLFIIISIPLPLTTVLMLCIDLGTDIFPAISLAYEKAEQDIMKRKPRNAKTDRLVTYKLISFSYLQIGMIQAFASLFTYFVVLGNYGFKPQELLFLNKDWVSKSKIINGLDYAKRVNALKNAQTAVFVSIVIVQWSCLLISKTRRLSIFHQGMRNHILNLGLFTETLLAAVLTYIPWINPIFGTQPIRFVYWLPALPFSLYILVYDELRKYFMRRNPGGWIEKNTYY